MEHLQSGRHCFRNSGKWDIAPDFLELIPEVDNKKNIYKIKFQVMISTIEKNKAVIICSVSVFPLGHNLHGDSSRVCLNSSS